MKKIVLPVWLFAGLALAAEAVAAATGNPAPFSLDLNTLLPLILPLITSGALGEHLYDVLLKIANFVHVPVTEFNSWIIRVGTVGVAPVVVWAIGHFSPAVAELSKTWTMFIFASLATAASMIATNHINNATELPKGKG